MWSRSSACVGRLCVLQAADLSRLIQEQNQMLCSLKELAERRQLQVCPPPGLYRNPEGTLVNRVVLFSLVSPAGVRGGQRSGRRPGPPGLALPGSAGAAGRPAGRKAGGQKAGGPEPGPAEAGGGPAGGAAAPQGRPPTQPGPFILLTHSLALISTAADVGVAFRSCSWLWRNNDWLCRSRRSS